MYFEKKRKEKILRRRSFSRLLAVKCSYVAKHHNLSQPFERKQAEVVLCKCFVGGVKVARVGQRVGVGGCGGERGHDTANDGWQKS